MDFWLSQLTLAAIYAMLVAGYDLIAERAGLLSLAHAAIFGVGAYVTALIMLDLGFTEILVLIVVAGALGAITSLPIAGLSLRVRKEYFAVTSMAFAVAFLAILHNVEALGLAEGLVGIPPATLLSVPITNKVMLAAFGCVVAAVVMLFVVWLNRTMWGLRLRAVRDSERGAVSLGINPVWMRTSAVVASGATAGVAGAVYVAYARFVSPDSFSMYSLAMIVAMLGLGSAVPRVRYVVGPAVLIGASSLIQYVHFLPLSILGPVNQLAYGLVMVLSIRLVPRGLGGSNAHAVVSRPSASGGSSSAPGAALPAAAAAGDALGVGGSDR
jgi:branched-chain amino acid transport system permease protein